MQKIGENLIFDVLRETFGFDQFRGEQEAVIRAVLNANDALLMMPTGMGKSLCYQLPARIFSKLDRGLTLVVSPLIALMKDQVDAAQAKGLRADFINSSLSADERQKRYKKLQKGSFEILYVTPERFRNQEFLRALAANSIALLAIDEAHCASAWGHDFRPDYSRLGDIRKTLGNPTTLALTATATEAVQKDILKILHLGNQTAVFHAGVRRSNLAIEVLPVHGMDEKVRAFVGMKHLIPGSAIVYFSLIQSLQNFSHQLRRLGLDHLVYHGQLGDRDRKKSQEQFIKSDQSVILATPAFGLGVDKANIRMVMHAEIPGSIEAYYQEIGRAGRDGERANCVLLFDGDDISIQSDFINWSNPDPGFIQGVYNLIDRNLTRAQQEGFDYLRTQMNFYNRRDFRVETAVHLLERWGSIEGLRPRDWKTVEAPPKEYLDDQEHAVRIRGQRTKLLELVEFLKSEQGCRMQKICSYFGFPDETLCGICDHCR